MNRFLCTVLLGSSFAAGILSADSGGTLPPPAVKPAGVQVKDGLISLLFKDTELREIFAGLSQITGISIVADSSVQGKVAFLSLRNVPLDDAVRSVATAGGLNLLRTGNVYTVGRNLNLKPVTATYKDAKLTLEATRADVKDVLQAVGQASGVNFIPAQEIQKFITVSLREVPLESSLQALLEANGLRMEKKNDQLFLVDAIKPPPPPMRPTNPASTPPVTQTPTTQPPVAAPPPVTKRTERVTLTLENVPLAEILNRISTLTGTSFVLTGELDDKLRRSVRFVDATVEEALAFLLAGTKYASVRVDGGRKAAPAKPSNGESNESNRNGDDPGEGSAVANLKSEIQNQKSFLIGDVTKLDAPEAAPFLVTEVVALKHLRATEAVTLLSARVTKEAVRPLKDQNALSLTGTREQVDRIRAEVTSLDAPAPQIMIQSTVVETTATNLKELGIEYLAQNNEIQAAGPTGSTLVFRTTGGFGKQFTATLTALVSQGRARILANPRVATINGKEASIDITDTRYFRTFGFPGQTAAGAQQQGNAFSPYAVGTIQSIDAGIKLKIVPWVGADGDILVDVTPEVSSVTGTGPEGLPELSRRVATTTVRVRQGESILIGGLRQREESKSVTKPFILGDLPLIGNLFRRTVKNKRESDLLILITPQLQETGLSPETELTPGMKDLLKPTPRP